MGSRNVLVLLSGAVFLFFYLLSCRPNCFTKNLDPAGKKYKKKKTAIRRAILCRSVLDPVPGKFSMIGDEKTRIFARVSVVSDFVVNRLPILIGRGKMLKIFWYLLSCVLNF